MLMGCFTPEQYQLCFEGLIAGFPTRIALANLLNAVAASPKLKQHPDAPINKKLRNINRITSETSDIEKMVYAIIQTIESASLCEELIIIAYQLSPFQPCIANLYEQSHLFPQHDLLINAENELETQLYALIKTGFNISELNEICFLIGIDEDSIAGNTIEDRSRSLIRYAFRHNQLQQLVNRCKELRPHLNWP